MYIKNFFKHTALVIRHRHKVFIHCCKCGIPFRGLVHDLSKFNPQEFFESVKYFQGNRSPIGACRRATGMSYAWLHHKGRNKHHIEYWLDPECKDLQPLIPYKYIVECVCDKLAATKTYAGKKGYHDGLAIEHWKRYGCKVDGNPKSMAFIEKVFTDLKEHGEKAVFNKKYMKHTYREICGEGVITLEKMQKELGIASIPEEWSKLVFEALRNQKTLFNIEKITDIIDKYGVLTKYKDEVIEAARELAADDAAALCVSLIDVSMRTNGAFSVTPYDIRPNTHRGRFALIFPYLLNVPRSVEFLKSHGISDEMISDTLYELERAIDVHVARTGVSGLLASSFNWLKLIYSNTLLRIGNLNFQMCGFGGKIMAFKKKTGEIMLLSASMRIHRSGRPLGAALCKNEDGAYDAVFTETDSEYIGNPIDENGVILNEQIHLSKDIWELALQPGDPVLAVHIPTGISLTEELCERSYALARKTFSECFPDYKYKAFSCMSWMMYRGLIDLTRPDSNLTKFLKKYTPFQRNAPGTGIFVFVYMLDPSIDVNTLDYKELPENTSLQRSIKQHYIDNKRVYEDGGIFF